MAKLPNETLDQIFGGSRPAWISFVKLLRVVDHEGELEADWRGQPIFTEPTFPRFGLGSRERDSYEEMLDRRFLLRRSPEEWWDERRPTKAPSHLEEPLLCTNSATRRTSIGVNPIVLPIAMGLPDELEHRKDYFMTASEYTALRHSQMSLDPNFDILCLQVGDLSDNFPDMYECKHVTPLSVTHPDTSRISKLAVEFHGPTTREWCKSCVTRYDDEDHESTGPFFHNSKDCHENIPIRSCKQPRGGCEKCEKYAEALNYHRPVLSLLNEFPAVRSLFLVDWAYEPVGAGPDPSTAHASNGDYDFFLVERDTEQERWRAERPCPFESLDCAESIERSLKWNLEVREVELTDALRRANEEVELAASKRPKRQASYWPKEELERRVRAFARELDAVLKRAEQPFECQVLAAVKRERPSTAENQTDSVAASNSQGSKRRQDDSELDHETQAKRTAGDTPEMAEKTEEKESNVC
ncbi:unnamed protein product [Clonostachys rosea]|uniref:Uncharacterized protein n=1 Tax=Bionectria ochroleuca TaxID=29856 RepID=A0ABY6U7Y8_BIOOC|nr:unnamed protein product [Clonostachys rosea]